MILSSWQRLTDFLHSANLMPLVVVVSIYHYHQALSSHDPLLVSLPIALFVDLLHYRTVRQAVRLGNGRWRLTAVFTTLIAFALQWIFYTQPGDGPPLAAWQALLFASLVPVGLAIMAWHQQQQAQETTHDWQQQAAEAQRRADEAQQAAADAQAEAAQAQGQATAAQQEAAQLQVEAEERHRQWVAAQEQLQAAQGQAEGARQEAAQARQQVAALQEELAAVQQTAVRRQEMLDQHQADVVRLQQQIAAGQQIQPAWQALPVEVQTLALFMAQVVTVQEAAERLDVHPSTVRRRAKRLQGADGRAG